MTELSALRWRMILGDCTGAAPPEKDACKAGILDTVFDMPPKISGRELAALLKGIGDTFPADAALELQRRALASPAARQKLHLPEVLENAQPDPHLAAALISREIPEKSRSAAAAQIEKAAAELTRRLRIDFERSGLCDRSGVSRKIDWRRTVLKNLKNYDIKERKLAVSSFVRARGGRARLPKRLILLIDRSLSMAAQTVTGVAACALIASLPLISVKLIAFTDTFADLSALSRSPAECLLALPACGGTDIAPALCYTESLVSSPAETVILLLSDFHDGGGRERLLAQARQITASGTPLYGICGLDPDGRTAHNALLVPELEDAGMVFFAPSPGELGSCIFNILAHDKN